MSTIMSGLNSGILEAAQFQCLPLVRSLEHIVMLFLNFLVSDMIMEVAPSITSTRRVFH